MQKAYIVPKIDGGTTLAMTDSASVSTQHDDSGDDGIGLLLGGDALATVERATIREQGSCRPPIDVPLAER